ncbi:MAG: VOC family protein [Alphaproteobacteria bacterium]|nr:VOC family protein [Alphaproteobacteria bacterium]
MKNAINWFEIFVADLPRAKRFYEKSFGCSLHQENFNGETIAMFPFDRTSGVGGSLTLSSRAKPSAEGPLLYLNAGDEMDAILARVPAAGGKVVMPRTAIPPAGSMAVFLDSEGNRVGLHSVN